jgi:hypothetical protein
MTLPPIDFAPLEPPDGDAHWERLAARIDAAAAPELARRAVLASNPVGLLLRRSRPLLAAAAAVLLLAGGALFWRREPPMDPTVAALAALAGVSYESALAAAAGPAPGLGQLIAPMEER